MENSDKKRAASLSDSRRSSYDDGATKEESSLYSKKTRLLYHGGKSLRKESCTRDIVDTTEKSVTANRSAQEELKAPPPPPAAAAVATATNTTTTTTSLSTTTTQQKQQQQQQPKNPPTSTIACGNFLPNDIIVRIISFVHISTLVTCRKVNRFMHQTFQNEIYHRLQHSNNSNNDNIEGNNNAKQSNDEDNDGWRTDDVDEVKNNNNKKQSTLKVQMKDKNQTFEITLRLVDDWTKEYTNEDCIVEHAVQTYCNPDLGIRWEDYQHNWTYNYNEDVAREFLQTNIHYYSMVRFRNFVDFGIYPFLLNLEREFPFTWMVSCEHRSSLLDVRNNIGQKKDLFYVFGDSLNHYFWSSTNNGQLQKLITNEDREEMDALKYCLSYLLLNNSILHGEYHLGYIHYKYDRSDSFNNGYERCYQLQLVDTQHQSDHQDEQATSSTTRSKPSSSKRVEWYSNPNDRKMNHEDRPKIKRVELFTKLIQSRKR